MQEIRRQVRRLSQLPSHPGEIFQAVTHVPDIVGYTLMRLTGGILTGMMVSIRSFAAFPGPFCVFDATRRPDISSGRSLHEIR